MKQYAITDRGHAETIRALLKQAANDIVDCWLRELEDCNAPSTGSTVPITGGDRSDPVANTAMDDTRERELNFRGSRITGHLDAMQKDVAKWTPRHADDVGKCRNCQGIAGVEDGLCPRCGRFYRVHKRLPDAKTVRETWEAEQDTRPCRRRCGSTIKIAENRFVCDDCQGEGKARRQKEYRDNRKAG